MTIYPRFPSFLGQAWCFFSVLVNCVVAKKSTLWHEPTTDLTTPPLCKKTHKVQVDSLQMAMSGKQQPRPWKKSNFCASYHTGFNTAYIFALWICIHKLSLYIIFIWLQVRWIDFDNALDHTIWNTVTALLNGAFDQWPPHLRNHAKSHTLRDNLRAQ